MNNEVKQMIDNGRLYHFDCHDQNDLFCQLNDSLFGDGLVKETYLEALKNREMDYPTGVMCVPYNIALPHVDSKHVNNNSLVVCILDKEVEFHRMDAIKETIPVKVVFALLISDESKHMKALSELTRIWSNEKIMTGIPDVNSLEELKKVLCSSGKEE